MRINNNISAVITNNQLLGTEESLADVMEKLSSGFNINHASDDPSGIAIAGRMQSQIDGLSQASDNGDDGISMLETAEGALNEVTSMLQRMRELCVQAANGTNSDSEKSSIQKEIDSLLAEIDRVSETTQFNTINLLDGSLDNRIYGDHVTLAQTTDDVPEGNYELYITKAATKATVGVATMKGIVTSETIINADTETKYSDTKISIDGTQSNLIDLIDNSTYLNHIKTWSITTTTERDGTTTTTKEVTSDTYDPASGASGNGLAISGTVTVNGYSIELSQGMSGEEVYNALRDGAEKGGATISDKDSLLSFESVDYGAKADLEVTFSSGYLAAALGFDVELNEDSLVYSTTGDNAKATLIAEGQSYNITYTDSEGNSETVNIDADDNDSMFGKQAVILSEGNKFTIQDVDGFEMTFKAEAGYTGLIQLDVTDIGGLTLHIGANMNQTMDVRIRNTSCAYMYIDDLDVTREDGPEEGMDALDAAIEYITGVRSQLGAYENRLEHTTASLDTTEENMTSAISRIEDADIATTMVEYTRLNVLEQAGTSALAQANELPQLALQLLQ